jgi:hypothetical protein
MSTFYGYNTNIAVATVFEDGVQGGTPDWRRNLSSPWFFNVLPEVAAAISRNIHISIVS